LVSTDSLETHRNDEHILDTISVVESQFFVWCSQANYSLPQSIREQEKARRL
jgi:hypothetical protein